MLGSRQDPHGESLNRKVPHYRPHNPFLVGLGTILIWFGWFAFNGMLLSLCVLSIYSNIFLGASTANLSLRSIYVVVNTNFAACGGGLTWTTLDYLFERKFSVLGFCSGVISGLVGITPAAGFGMFSTLI